MRKKQIGWLQEALQICQGKKLLLGYKLLSCSLCRMGFKSSPAAAPHLACWNCRGLALKLLQQQLVCRSLVVPAWLWLA